MMSARPPLAALVVFVALLSECSCQGDCTRQDYDKCVKIADPLMKDAHLIFPDNMQDIDIVCRRWSQFVDCVKRYTDRCFTETRRQDFNKAIASPVDSVHQMCTDAQYQKEYMQYAKCIKSTLIKEEHCGKHYKHLVEQVSGDVSRVTLCCSHHRFRECVLAETKRECDKGQDNAPAARFSKQILDKALSFIRDQCYNYIPSTGYCPGVAVPSLRVDHAGHGHGMISGHKGSAPDQGNRPWQAHGVKPTMSPNPAVMVAKGESGEKVMAGGSTHMPDMAHMATAKPMANMPATRPAMAAGVMANKTMRPMASTIPTTLFRPGNVDKRVTISSETGGGHPWMPNKPGGGVGVTKMPGSSEEKHVTVSSAWMPSRSPKMTMKPGMGVTMPGDSDDNVRPSSYGRGMSWTPSNTEPSDWLTKTWKVTSNQGDVDEENDGLKHKTDSWRPNMAGFGGVSNNEVDEPNQQGLEGSDRSSAPQPIRGGSSTLLLLPLTAVFWLRSLA